MVQTLIFHASKAKNVARLCVCVCFFHWFDTCVACNRYRSVKWKIPFVDVILIAAMPIIQLILNYNVIIIYIYYIFVSVVLLLSGATMSGAK